jgi:hypothetical protein
MVVLLHVLLPAAPRLTVKWEHWTSTLTAYAGSPRATSNPATGIQVGSLSLSLSLSPSPSVLSANLDDPGTRLPPAALVYDATDDPTRTTAAVDAELVMTHHTPSGTHCGAPEIE